MARRGIKRYASKPNNKNQIWTVIQIDAGLVAASPWNIFNVVQDSDWSTTGGRRKATLLSIRGWLSFHQVGATGVDVQGYFVKKDEDVNSGASLDPFVSGTYVDEDIMFTLGYSVPVGAVADVHYTKDYEINIKSKRKIQTGETVGLIAAASAVNEAHVIGILRGLIQLN